MKRKTLLIRQKSKTKRGKRGNGRSEDQGTKYFEEEAKNKKRNKWSKEVKVATWNVRTMLGKEGVGREGGGNSKRNGRYRIDVISNVEREVELGRKSG